MEIGEGLIVGRAPDLLTQRVLVFRHEKQDRHELLHHRILNEAGGEIGTVAEIGKVLRQFLWLEWRRFPKRIAVLNREGAKVVEVARTGGDRRVEVADGAGRVVGMIDSNRGFFRAGYRIEGEFGRRLGGIKDMKRSPGFDYVVEDETGAEVARLAPGRSRWWKRPEEHILTITGSVTPDFRLIIIGAGAGLYLALEVPPSEQGD